MKMGHPQPSSKREPPRKRRAHRKSRAGCRNCKLRRVKCDETRPACRNCVGLLVTCNYDLVPCSATSPALHEGDLNFTMSETNLANDALVTDLNRMVASQYPPTWDSGQFRSISRYDIDLLKRWDTRTVFTMGTYSISLCYQLTVSKEATQHPYLFHAALAMAAMHDGSLQVSREPSSTNNSQATQYYHHSCAAALFNHRLSRSVDKPADHNAIWATASMLGNMASFSIKTYDPELAWPMAPSTDSSLGWMEMHKGVYTVYKMASPGDPGGMFHAIINDPQYTFLKNKWDEDTREGTEDIPPQFVALCDLDPSSNAQNNPYHATVRGLAAIWDMECTQDTALRFISIISLMRPEMSALLMQKDARALLLLAYWFTKMFHVHWWFQQRCFVECAAICMYLKRYYHSDPLIMDMVQYPLSRLEAAFSDPGTSSSRSSIRFGS